MRVQASLEFLLIGSAVAAMCLFVVAFYAHNMFAQASSLSSLANDTPNNSYYASLSGMLDAYSATYPNTSQQYYSVQISDRQEHLEYALGSPSYLVNLTQFSHCTYLGFFGNPYNITGQCGTADAWYYFASYGCQIIQNGAFCIVPHNSGYYLMQTNGNRSYSYGFALELGTPYGTMQAQLNSSAPEATVLLAGTPVGTASVVGVTSAEPYESVQVLGSNATLALANQTAYVDYSQAQNMLYPVLRFYNGTSASSSTQASIEQAIASFNASEESLVQSSTQPVGCSIEGSAYVCTASSPFLYVVNVTLGPDFSGVNETLYYLGSEINIVG